MPRRLAATYVMLGHGVPPPSPLPEEEDRAAADDFFGEFDEEDKEEGVREAERKEEWSDGPEPADPEQRAIGTQERLIAQTLQECDDAVLARVIDMSRERAPTEDGGRLLMNAERRIIDLNAQTLADAAAREAQSPPKTRKLDAIGRLGLPWPGVAEELPRRPPGAGEEGHGVCRQGREVGAGQASRQRQRRRGRPL